MGFLPAITAGQAAAAAAGVSAVTSVAAARQASATGKFNQRVAERNAAILEYEKEKIAKQTEFTIARFEKQFAQMQGNTKTAILKSGVTLEGSGLNILRYNTEQAEIEKDTLDYNSKVAEYQKIEQANFARMQGTIARQEGRIAALGYYAQAGTSLLKGFG